MIANNNGYSKTVHAIGEFSPLFAHCCPPKWAVSSYRCDPRNGDITQIMALAAVATRLAKAAMRAITQKRRLDFDLPTKTKVQFTVRLRLTFCLLAPLWTFGHSPPPPSPSPPSSTPSLSLPSLQPQQPPPLQPSSHPLPLPPPSPFQFVLLLVA